MRWLLLLVAVGGLASAALVASWREAPLPPIAGPMGPPAARRADLGAARDAELLALEAASAELATMGRAELDEALGRWRAFRASVPRGSEHAEVCAMRIGELELRRTELAGERHTALLKEIAVHGKAGRFDRCRELITTFRREFAGTPQAEAIAARLEQVDLLARDHQRTRFEWSLGDFARRVGKGALVGARFQGQAEQLAIHAADGVRHRGNQLQLYVSAGSKLEVGFALKQLPPRLEVQLNLGGSTLYHVSHARISLTVNGQTVFAGWTPFDAHPNTFSWPIRQLVSVGDNRVALTLDREARTFLGLYGLAIVGRE